VMQYLIFIGLFCGVRKSLYVVNRDLISCVCHVEIVHWRILFRTYAPHFRSTPSYPHVFENYATVLKPAVKRAVCCVCVCSVFILCY
jgi:hypothetical protein